MTLWSHFISRIPLQYVTAIYMQSGDYTLTQDSSSEDSGRDKIPQKLVTLEVPDYRVTLTILYYKCIIDQCSLQNIQRSTLHRLHPRRPLPKGRFKVVLVCAYIDMS